MKNDSIEDNLSSVFSNVNDWLKFAEQKNAALLVLNGGIVWGLTRILSNFSSLENFSYWSALAGYVLIVSSAIICIVSFLPVLKEKWFKPENQDTSDNCFYFADIAKYNKSEYVSLLSSKIGMEDYKATAFELDLSSQVVTNAEIALDKYKRFKIASTITIISVLLFAMSIGFHYF